MPRHPDDDMPVLEYVGPLLRPVDQHEETRRQVQAQIAMLEQFYRAMSYLGKGINLAFHAKL